MNGFIALISDVVRTGILCGSCLVGRVPARIHFVSVVLYKTNAAQPPPISVGIIDHDVQRLEELMCLQAITRHRIYIFMVPLVQLDQIIMLSRQPPFVVFGKHIITGDRPGHRVDVWIHLLLILKSPVYCASVTDHISVKLGGGSLAIDLGHLNLICVT